MLTFGGNDGARQLSSIGSGTRFSHQMQASEDCSGIFDVEVALLILSAKEAK